MIPLVEVSAMGKKKAILAMFLALFVGVGLFLPASTDARVRTHVWIGLGPWWGWYYPPPAWYPVYVYPAPVYAPCRSIWVEGRWERRAFTDDTGFTTYRDVWVPGHWERVCP